jgi:hypothetical protein
MKVLFLDIDGVLNSRKWYEANKEAIALESGIMYRAAVELDPAACALVNGLCTEFSLAIVISSTWRRLHTTREIQMMFASRGLHAPIIGSTPQLRSGFRGQEIEEWLYDHPGIKKYVILDDDGDFIFGQPLVQTDNRLGVTTTNIWEARDLLK